MHADTPVDRPRNLPIHALVCAAALSSLLGCTPAFDWRSVPVPGTQLVTELPCRPSRFQRDVTVAGTPLKLFMLSCEAGGVTYGVATAEVGDLTRVDAVLHGLAESARDTIRSSEARFAALNMGGATPFSGNSSAHLRGRRPDGQAVDESIRVFARGSRVFQASAIGAHLPEQALAPFEQGLRFDLARDVDGQADPR